jgi:hypothetical protein
MKKLNTKVMMWIFTIVNLLSGLMTLFTGQSIAEASWGKENVLGHDKFYEQGYGWAFIAISVIGFGIAMYTTGKAQAKLALLSAASTIVFLGGFSIMGSQNEQSYKIAGAQLIPAVILLVLLLTSGFQGLKSAD